METTKKEILKYLNKSNKLDNLSIKELKELELKEIAFSTGLYGVNALLMLSKKDNNYYVCTSRCSNLFYLM